MEDSVKLEINDRVATLILNRPKSLNSFGLDMIQFISERLTELSGDSDVVGVVITGKGKAFCAGGDLRWVADSGKSYGEAFHTLAARYHQAILEIRHMPKPVIAAINGLAAGGGFSMALACDFRIMEKSAFLKQAYTSNGLSIDGGGTFTLPRLAGMAKALEIATFDNPISADQAFSWGLVTRVVEDGSTLEKAMELAKEIAKGSLSSFAASKKLLMDSFSTPFEVQLEKERAFLAWCAEQPDGQEGIKAFLEKGKPSPK